VYGAGDSGEKLAYVPEKVTTWRHGHSNRNFNARRKAGEIVMAPYSIGTSTSKRYIVGVPHRYKKRWSWFDHSGSTCCDYWNWFGQYGHTEQFTLGDAEDRFPTYGDYATGGQTDIDKAVSKTQIEAYARSYDGVDLLTELAEAEKTYQLGVDLIGGAASTLAGVKQRVGRKTPKSWKDMTGRDLIRASDKRLRKAGSIWLGAIYGVLPVAYLVKDAFDVNRKKKFKFHTYRSTRELPVTTDMPTSLPETYLRKSYEGLVTVKSTVKVSYKLGTTQYLADQISVNPFRTAWELIPFSFVVDWFFNVGDLITSSTSLDLSTQRVGCTSVKRDVQESVSLVDNSSDVSDLIYNPSTPCPVQSDETYYYERSIDALLSTVIEQSFNRTLFNRPVPELHFDPYVHWTNVVTAIALAYRPTSDALRRLRI
jgi:uncharacterized protein YjeT (DUF2065 family)